MKKVTQEEILSYYASSKFQPIMPMGTSWRHFRFKLKDGGWRKVPTKIKDADGLRKWIIKLGGLDLYYSTSRWMNPHKVAAKGCGGAYHIADNLIFSNDLVFDIDAKGPVTLDSLNEARKSTWNIYQAMKDYDEFAFEYCAFTGYKGFRLTYMSKTPELPRDARKRLDSLEKKRKLFIEDMSNKLKESGSTARKQGTYALEAFYDKEITRNPMCVIRVIGSVHSTTGYVSTKIVPSLLKRNMKTILDQIPYISKSRPGIPKREMTQTGGKETMPPRPRLLQSAKDVTGLASLPHITKKYFITNRVLGIKQGFIPIFIYQKTQRYYKKELLKLQKMYRLGSLYIYEQDDKIIAMSLKCMQKRRLQKVLNASSSRTKADFKKYKRIYAPFAMDLSVTLDSDFVGYQSRGHAIFVLKERDLGKSYCGWSKIELIRAVREENEL